jgi:GNAT superfamily N-acetyltransferase
VATVLRSPGLDDAGALGEVHVEAWRATYRNLMPDADLDGLRVEDRARWWVEVLSRHVRPATWGSGLGSALLTVAQTGLATAGFGHAVLWLVPGNVRARRFSQRAGWRDDDVTRVEQVHGVRVEEVRYRRTLPAG